MIGGDDSIPNYQIITNFLQTKFTPAQVNQYSQHLKVFFVRHNGGVINNQGNYDQLGGFSLGLKTDVVVFDLSTDNLSTNTYDQSTVAHEVYHSLGVGHTFNRLVRQSPYIYQPLLTDNLMDYSHTVGIRTKSLYHWQWELARRNV